MPIRVSGGPQLLKVVIAVAFVPDVRPPSRSSPVVAGSGLGLGFLGGLGGVLLELLRNADSSVVIALIASSTVIIVTTLLTSRVLDRQSVGIATGTFLGKPVILDRNRVLKDLLLNSDSKPLQAVVSIGDTTEIYPVLAFGAGSDRNTQVLLGGMNDPTWFELSDVVSVTMEMNHDNGQRKQLPPA